MKKARSRCKVEEEIENRRFGFVFEVMARTLFPFIVFGLQTHWPSFHFYHIETAGAGRASWIPHDKRGSGAQLFVFCGKRR